MAQFRPTPVNDAAQQLGVREGVVSQMIAVGQIAVDSHKPTVMVVVRDDPKAKPRYTASPPPMKSTFHAASVMISGSAPAELAELALHALADIGFLVKAGSRETYITPTDLLKVETVPEIKERIEAVVGKDKVTAFITAYDRRGPGPCPLVPDPLG